MRGRSEGQLLIGSLHLMAQVLRARPSGAAKPCALAASWPGAMTQPDLAALATTASMLPMIIGSMMWVIWLREMLGLTWKPLSAAPEMTSRSTCSGCRIA